MFKPKKRGINLETKLLEARHTSKPKFFYLGSPNSISKLAFSNVCGLRPSQFKEKRQHPHVLGN
jgi:hypothetical protein